jgi:hypothetical protein
MLYYECTFCRNIPSTHHDTFLSILLQAITDYVSSVQGEYQDWDYFRDIRNTLEKDMAYVEYYETLVKETKV